MSSNWHELFYYVRDIGLHTRAATEVENHFYVFSAPFRYHLPEYEYLFHRNIPIPVDILMAYWLSFFTFR